VEVDAVRARVVFRDFWPSAYPESELDVTQPGAHPACADAAAHVDEGLRAIRALDPTLRACIHVREDEASLEARDVDAGVRSGPLAGWTLAVKDNMDLAGSVRTDGLAPGHPPPAQRDATAVRRLRDAGAVVLAKTNLEALSLGATTQNPAWGACRNPWDLTRVPGGSSGGSAVAVAAGMVDAAVGTDTGGSVRNPAALCGISALRPTPGWIPTDGVTPLSPDFDVVGPMARSAGALRAMLAVLAGRPAPHRLPAALRGLRVGVPDEFFYDDLHPEVAGGCETLLDLLAAAGAALRPVRLRGAQTCTEPCCRTTGSTRRSATAWPWGARPRPGGVPPRGTWRCGGGRRSWTGSRPWISSWSHRPRRRLPRSDRAI
jgi:Asp-tRNA(Asn)/Glu-tRNA(Gln) amidotransferase A subunit family amidase